MHSRQTMKAIRKWQLTKQPATAGKRAEMLKARAAPLYHGSSHKIDTLVPRDDHGDPDVPAAVFATPYKQMALAYLGGRWGDRDINQGSRGVNDKGWYLQEMRPGAFDASYKGQEGWLHELPPESFVRPKRSRGSSFELISTEPVTPVRAKRIKNIRLALRRAGVQLIPYGSDPKMYEMAVKRMRQRIGLFGEQERERYLRWVGETNPELEERLTKRSAVIPGVTLISEQKSPLSVMLRAKAESDRGNFSRKHAIMRRLLQDKYNEFVVDSEDGRFVGLTHIPTNFKMHLPRGVAYSAPVRPLRTQEEIFDDVRRKLPSGVQHASGGLPDVKRLSDVDISLYTASPDSIVKALPKGVTIKTKPTHTVYSIPGYERPVNLFVSPDKSLAERAVRHREIQMALRNYPSLMEKARALKAKGMKTEPAFASALGLEGDPYEVMLDRDKVLGQAATR